MCTQRSFIFCTNAVMVEYDHINPSFEASKQISRIEGIGESEPAESEPTASETADSTACMVSASANVNQRTGPGTNYDIDDTLVAGQEVAATGQTTGTDGFVWWQLDTTFWVRSDIVNATGDCESLPVVSP